MEEIVRVVASLQSDQPVNGWFHPGSKSQPGGGWRATFTQARCQRAASDMVHHRARYSNTETIGDTPKGIRPCLTVLEFHPACVATSRCWSSAEPRAYWH